MGDNLNEFVLKENLLARSLENFRLKLIGIVTPEQEKKLLIDYQELYHVANGDYRKSQNS